MKSWSSWKVCDLILVFRLLILGGRAAKSKKIKKKIGGLHDSWDAHDAAAQPRAHTSPSCQQSSSSMSISSAASVPDTIYTTGNKSNKALGGFRDDDGAEEAEKNAAPKTKTAVRYYRGGVNPKTSKVHLQ